MTQTPRHMRPRECTALIKRQVVQAAVSLMTRAGIDVEHSEKVTGEKGTAFSLHIFIPADSSDPHGARFQKAIESAG